MMIVGSARASGKGRRSGKDWGKKKEKKGIKKENNNVEMSRKRERE
jgi:hypothetical protein